MERVIKFRQPIFNRDGTFKDWHYWGIGIEQGGEIVTVGWLTKNGDIADPKQSQQFTGRTDKAGREIYGKDKISVGGKVFEVYFGANKFLSEDYLMWSVRSESSNRTYAFDGSICKGKIIGNCFAPITKK